MRSTGCYKFTTKKHSFMLLHPVFNKRIKTNTTKIIINQSIGNWKKKTTITLADYETIVEKF